MRKKPYLANKLLIKLSIVFYGNKFCKKSIKLIDNGALSKLKPPYIVVANHCSFVDVGALIKMMYPTCANFVISETQKVQWPKLINYMGILPKKQFSTDMSLIFDIKYCLSKNRPVVIYPEAKLSVVGTPNIIKPSVAKLVKMFKVPLVTVCFDGSYLHQPRWSKAKRFVPVVAHVKLAVNAEEAKNISTEEIFCRIKDNLKYDDYAYQLQNKIEIDTPDLAEGLEAILYKCPECGEEFCITGHGNQLCCTKCGTTVTQNKFGQLEGGKFDKVTDWYAWQTECVKKQIIDGTYAFDENFFAQKLVKDKYVDLGRAKITHGAAGIDVDIEQMGKIHFDVGFFYTLSFNNDYIYLPIKEAVYRFKRVADVGCTTKLNIAIEQQTQLAENVKG